MRLHTPQGARGGGGFASHASLCPFVFAAKIAPQTTRERLPGTAMSGKGAAGAGGAKRKSDASAAPVGQRSISRRVRGAARRGGD
jgi:hypothetical protein